MVEIEIDAMLLFVRTYRLPVIYVFGQKPIDGDHCVTQFVHILGTLPTENASTKKRAVLLRHDVAYSHRAGELLLAFHNDGRLSD
jgi:diphthamide biosynthesis protein 2